MSAKRKGEFLLPLTRVPKLVLHRSLFCYLIEQFDGLLGYNPMFCWKERAIVTL